MEAEKYDILITGELVGNDLLLAEHLGSLGLTCLVVRQAHSSMPVRERFNAPISLQKRFTEQDIHRFHTPWEFLRLARRCRLILSCTGSLVDALGRLWLLRHFLNLPPVVNLTTGSDITELAAGETAYASRYRQYLRFARLNWCVPYPHAVKNLISCQIPNVVFLHFPYYLHAAVPQQVGTRLKRPIRFFHPSHLDWQLTDPKPGRNSSKGNDRFLRAYARAINAGLDAHCTILDRGPDRQAARQMISEQNVSERFTWKPHLTRDELLNEIIQADVVVDQFDIGGLGGITAEAMSLGKPVMIYLQENCLRLAYPEPAPVLNCSSEEEIFQQLMRCADQDFISELGKNAQKWVFQYHSPQNSLEPFLFYYSQFTGKVVKDYGWDYQPGTNLPSQRLP